MENIRVPYHYKVMRLLVAVGVVALFAGYSLLYPFILKLEVKGDSYWKGELEKASAMPLGRFLDAGGYSAAAAGIPPVAELDSCVCRYYAADRAEAEKFILEIAEKGTSEEEVSFMKAGTEKAEGFFDENETAVSEHLYRCGSVFELVLVLTENTYDECCLYVVKQSGTALRPENGSEEENPPHHRNLTVKSSLFRPELIACRYAVSDPERVKRLLGGMSSPHRYMTDDEKAYVEERLKSAETLDPEPGISRGYLCSTRWSANAVYAVTENEEGENYMYVLETAA